MLIQDTDLCYIHSYVQLLQLTGVIKSPYNGTIHKIHYNVDEFAKVGKPLVDIYVENGE